MVKTRARHILRSAAVIALMLMPVPATSVTNAPDARPELPPATAAVDLDAGATAVEQHQYDLASRRLTRAIDSGALSHEALALAYHHRGIARQKLGYEGLAIKDYTSAMKLNTLPGDVLARAYYNRGLARAKSGDTLGAELDYSHAIEILPSYGAAYHNRANLERLRHDYPTAIRDYSLAIDNLNGNDRTLPLMGRALSYEKSGKIAEANNDLDSLLKLAPDYKPATRLRTQLASLAANQMAVAQTDDQLETGSISPSGNSVAPRHGEVIDHTHQNGWDTTTVRYANAANTSHPKLATSTGQNADDDIVTGSLRPIDLVPAPGQEALEPVQVAEVDSNAPVQPLTAAGQFRVQLGAFRAPALAAQAWNEIVHAHPALVTAMSHAVEKADLGARGIYYRLQAGDFPTANDARSRCADFTAHRINCIVVSR